MALPEHLYTSLKQALGRSLAKHQVEFFAYLSPTDSAAQRQAMLQQLHDKPARATAEHPHTAHVGVAGLFNLDALAAGGHDVALLCDINQHQMRLWNTALQTIKEAETPAAFTQAMHNKLRVVEGIGVLSDTEGAPIELATGVQGFEKYAGDSYFLSSQKAYDAVREKVKAGKVIPLQIDIFDENRVTKLRQWLDTHGVGVRSVYASNIFSLVEAPAKSQPDVIEHRKDPFGRMEHAKPFAKQAIEQLMNHEDSALFHCHTLQGVALKTAYGFRPSLPADRGRG